MSEFAPGETQVTEYGGHHGRRRDAERDGHQQREAAAGRRVTDERDGEDPPESEARDHREQEASECDARKQTAPTPDGRQVDLQPSEREQAHGAEAGDPEQHRGRHLIAGEQVVRERGRHPAEAARPADDPGRDVADHCRLPDLAGQRTEPERGAEQHRDLREEMRRRVGRDGLERGYHHGSVSSRVGKRLVGSREVVVQPFPCRRCHVRPVGVAVQLAVARTSVEWEPQERERARVTPAAGSA